MTRTYYEVLNAEGQPATERQRKLLGTAKYGYATRGGAEIACPNDCTVCVRYVDGTADWSGPIVSLRLSDGRLERLPAFEGF